MGRSVASVGNMTKMAVPAGDVVIGAKGGTGNSGRAYLVLQHRQSTSLSAADAVIDGAAASDEMGIAIGGVSIWTATMLQRSLLVPIGMTRSIGCRSSSPNLRRQLQPIIHCKRFE